MVVQQISVFMNKGTWVFVSIYNIYTFSIEIREKNQCQTYKNVLDKIKKKRSAIKADVLTSRSCKMLIMKMLQI